MMPGYDRPTGIFGIFDARRYTVPAAPSRVDAEAAAARLIELLKEFEFSDDADFSAALSAILTAAIRSSLPLAPMFHVTAHMPGSGKSYLCELITSFATSQRSAPMRAIASPGSGGSSKSLSSARFLGFFGFAGVGTDMSAGVERSVFGLFIFRRSGRLEMSADLVAASGARA